MKINIKELENKNHKNDGTWGTFYLNGEKYTGIVYDIFEEQINWIFEVNDGLQNGIEKSFHEGSDILEQITEYKDNRQYGISKEFDEEGKLINVSVIYYDDYLKTISIENDTINQTSSYNGKYEDKLPTDIQKLLDLTSKELIDYEFKNDNENLNLDIS